MINLDLSQKTILITGGSAGIGKELSHFLLGTSARLAVHYHQNEKSAVNLLKGNTTDSRAFQADLSQEKEVFQLFDAVLENFEKIDTIIHNAGVFIPHSTQEDTAQWLSVWKKTMDVNLNAVGLMTKLGIDQFKKQGHGRFIYIGSRAAFRGETEEYLAYAASKGGLTSLARSVARSFGKDNIKSFVVAPGFTRTKMAENFISTHGEEKVLNEIALNTLTEPKDLAPLIGLMCSGLMDHATGATIDVNAGSHIR